MKEVEISLKGLIFYILKRWKSIVVVMLIGAIAIGGLQMIRDIGRTQTVQPIVEAGNSLSDSEKTYVESVYDYLNELQLINEVRKDSLFMNLDSKNLVKTELTYMISVDVPEKLEGIELAYKYYLNGSEFNGYISEKTDIKNTDIADTVSISSERSRDVALNTSIKIIILSVDESSAEEITKAVNTYLIEKSGELLRNGYEHELTEIGYSTYRGLDLNVENRQLQLLQEIQTRNKTIIDTENAIKDAQKEYYESLADGSDENYTSDDTEVVFARVYVRPSVKHIAMGLFAGAFLMCGIYFLLYIFANRLDEEDDVERLYGTYLIGTVTGNDYGKLIYKLQHIGKRSFEFDESIKLICTKIKMTAQKEGISRIGIIGCGIEKRNEKAAKAIVAALKSSGMEVLIIDEPIYDPTSAEKLLGVESAVLLERAGVTYRTEIWKEIEMIKKLGIKAEGLVIAE